MRDTKGSRKPQDASKGSILSGPRIHNIPQEYYLLSMGCVPRRERKVRKSWSRSQSKRCVATKNNNGGNLHDGAPFLALPHSASRHARVPDWTRESRPVRSPMCTGRFRVSVVSNTSLADRCMDNHARRMVEDNPMTRSGDRP